MIVHKEEFMPHLQESSKNVVSIPMGMMTAYNGMRVLAVAMSKGGVGKTFAATNIAIRAASGDIPEIKKKVLLIDIDVQQNSSCAFLKMETVEGEDYLIPPIHPNYDPNDPDHIEWGGRSNSMDLYLGNPLEPYPSLTHENLHILPSNGGIIDLFEGSKERTSSGMLDVVYAKLHEFFSNIDVQNLYDLIIFDCPPGKSILTLPVIRAATDVLLPTKAEILSTQGVSQMMNTIEKENSKRSYPINVVGIVPNQVRNIKKHTEEIDSIREKSPERISKYLSDFNITDRTIFKNGDIPFFERSGISYKDKKAEEEMQKLVSMVRERMYVRPIQ